jgi:formate hydrogenlyase transcriptional activator
MLISPDLQNDIDDYKSLLLDMPWERSLAGVLSLIVRRLAARPHTALVRIWLLKPADICAVCPSSKGCPGEDNCLHLVASAGNPINSPGEDWSRLDGKFSRFPVGVRKVGKIAATGQPIEVLDIEADHTWIASPDWAKREKNRGFIGLPLVCWGEKLGVLVRFTRERSASEDVEWLRMVADHAAMSIVNARPLKKLLAFTNSWNLKVIFYARKSLKLVVWESSSVRVRRYKTSSGRSILLRQPMPTS